MLAMKDTLENVGYSVDVLCYDGVMVRKDVDRPMSRNVLECVETKIEELTGYSVDLIIKPFSYFEMPEITEEIVPNVSRAEYCVS